MSRAPNRIRPLVGSSMPAIMFMVVVFPQPDGPSSAMNSPSAIWRSIVFSAVKPPNFLTKFCKWMALISRPLPGDRHALHGEDRRDREHDQDGECDRRDV